VSFHLGSCLTQLFDIGNANIWMTMAPLNPTLLDIDYQLINKSSSITIRHIYKLIKNSYGKTMLQVLYINLSLLDISTSTYRLLLSVFH